jgi:hypothetical protein
MIFLSKAIRSSLFAAVATTASVSFSQYNGAVEPPEHLATGFQAVSEEQSREWLGILAGPVFEGRGTGQLGYVRAAHWVAGKVAEFGLEPKGEAGTYFQFLPVTRQTIDPDQSQIMGGEGLSIPGAEFGLDRFLNQAEIAGKLAFVKLVGNSPRVEENLRDKVVICVADEQNAGRASFLLARQRPAVVLRVVDSTPSSSPQLRRPRSNPTGTTGTITMQAAQAIAEAGGVSTDWLSVSADDKTGSTATDFDLSITLRIRDEPVAVPNVLAWIPGSDPDLRHEYIVIGAHLDHLGYQGGIMYPGADDNGSGSTAILNIAKAMAANPVKPKRSILFTWFAAEEVGLVGSAYYCDNPLLPFEDMVCMLNIDMVGRNEEKPNEPASENEDTLHLVGSKKGDLALHDIIERANQYINLVFEFDEEGVFGRSDQANYYKKGVSVAFLFGGFHPDYHQPSDKPEKINYKKLVSAARLFYIAAHLAADHGRFLMPSSEKQTEKTE